MVSCYFTMCDGVQPPDSRGQTMSWPFLACAAVFITCLLTANVIAAKLVVIAGVVLPAGVVIFPVSYIVADVLTEVWGYSAARRVIWLGFACNLLMVAAIWVGGELPAAAFWRGQPAYVEILGQTPRLLAASFVAYLVGEFANAYVMARMKVLTSGRWLWTRTIGSTIVGEGLDSAVFIVLAFGGAMPAPALFGVILAQWTVKVVYEAAATPITYAVVAWLKGREGLDTYDVSTDFNPMQL
jgi:queuosine precursor transporter